MSESSNTSENATTGKTTPANVNINNVNINNVNNVNNLINKTNIIDDIKNFKFYKWCNCERTSKEIMVKCYDNPLEAIAEYEKQVPEIDNNYYDDYYVKETVLLPIFKYMPKFIQKNSIQNQFKRPILFDFPTLSSKVGCDKSSE